LFLIHSYKLIHCREHGERWKARENRNAGM